MSAWIVATLKATTVSHWMIQLSWLWPLCETLHFVGLTLSSASWGCSISGLLGFVRRLPVAAVHSLIPWGILGFAINLVTGVLFFVGAPDQYIDNVAWWFKIAFLAIAGANVLYFETTQARRAMTIGAGEDTPHRLKVIAAVSIVFPGSWCSTGAGCFPSSAPRSRGAHVLEVADTTSTGKAYNAGLYGLQTQRLQHAQTLAPHHFGLTGRVAPGLQPRWAAHVHTPAPPPHRLGPLHDRLADGVCRPGVAARAGTGTGASAAPEPGPLNHRLAPCRSRSHSRSPRCPRTTRS